MKKFLFVGIVLGLISMMVLSGCGGSSSFSAVKPAAAEVKTAYDTVNNKVNYLCSSDVNTTLGIAGQKTCSYVDGTLSVSINTTAATIYPFTVVYTMNGFVAGTYTVNGSQTAIITADGWTAKGNLTGTGSDISSMLSDMVHIYATDTTTGTLTVNGYPYDYATAAYK